MAIDIKEIKRLRELTGVGMTDAKKALEETDGDFDKALQAMRQKGLTRAEKKAEREAREGLIDAYVHDGRIGVVVEVNCETDFVTRTDGFKQLVHDLALHITASAPEYVSLEDVPAAERQRAAAEFRAKAEAEGKPAAMAEKIVDGQLAKYLAEKCLLSQPFIKNPDQTVEDIVKQAIARLGENIVVRRFRRIALGEVE